MYNYPQRLNPQFLHIVHPPSYIKCSPQSGQTSCEVTPSTIKVLIARFTPFFQVFRVSNSKCIPSIILTTLSNSIPPLNKADINLA